MRKRLSREARPLRHRRPIPRAEVLWNFEKFLVGRDGSGRVGRFAPDITPDDPLIVEAIEKELAK